jgi:putative tricarboxylic transport membrane protein
VNPAPGGAYVPGSSGGHPAAGATPLAASTHDAAAAPISPIDEIPLEELTLEEAVQRVEELEHEGRPPLAGTLSNVLTAVAVVALGIGTLIGSAELGIGTASKPGSGTWPMIVSIVTILLGLGLLAVARRSHDGERFAKASLLVLVGLATMIVFVVLLPIIGFEIPAALLCFVWLRFLGGEGWRLSTVLSIALVAAFYLIFVGALSVPIPHLF